MKKKPLSLLLALVLSLGMFTAGALAASGTRTIEVTYRDIKLVVDGTEVALKDGAGNSIEPFLYNGTTYLPVRAVGEALGKEVNWDGNTNTVYVGAMSAPLPYQVNNGTIYDGKNADASFSVAGKVYKTGVMLQSVHSSVYENNSSGKKLAHDGDAIWNTEGFQSMTFTIGHIGDLQRNATLFVSLDGVSSGEYELKWDGSPQTITVPLGGSPNVKLTLVADPADVSFQFYSPNPYVAQYGLYDIKLS